MALSLPTKKSKPVQGLHSFTMLIYGREKIGKTTLCEEFEDAFFLMFEPGGKDCEIYQRPVTNWKTFIGYIDLLEAEKDQFKTVVIDTMDVCARMCQRYVCKKFNMQHPSDEEYGKGWDYVREELTIALARLTSLGRGVIFLAHADEKKIKRSTGFESSRIMPRLSGQASSVVEPMVDIWAYYAYEDDGKRTLHIRGDDLISAGHRLRRNFVGIDKISMGASSAEAYKNFIAAYNTGPKEGGAPAKRRLTLRR